jgi:glycosyltransferase involved in cell wall biosynthesis
MPEFSVIIPAYNAEQYIERAIHSAIAQSYPASEIIVVDDGSKDRTFEIASGFGSPVKVIRQPNSGVAMARTTGVQLASGDWIALLDSDDMFLPEKLQRQRQIIESNKTLAIVYSGVRLLSDSGVTSDRPAFSPEKLWPALRFRSPIVPSTAVIRKSALVEAGYFNTSFRICDDWYCWLSFVRRYSATAFDAANEPLCIYRVSEGSLSKRTLEMLNEIERIVQDSTSDLPPISRSLWRRRSLSRHYYETSIALREQKSREFSRYMWKSLYLWPLWGEIVPFRRYKVAAHMCLNGL